MKLLHLYYDIMNLYGEWANVAAMQRILEKSGAEVTVDKLTIGDSINLKDYDFIYMGSGTERNQRMALDDFCQYESDLRACIRSGKVILLTGNAFEILGKTITDAHGQTFEGMGVFDFTVTEQNKKRVTGDVIYTCDFLRRPLVGFVNKCSEIKGAGNALFTVERGLGNCEGEKTEGVRLNYCFGTHLTGPVLIKNPHFLIYLAEKILDGAAETEWMIHEREGYRVTLRELKNNPSMA